MSARRGTHGYTCFIIKLNIYSTLWCNIANPSSATTHPLKRCYCRITLRPLGLFVSGGTYQCPLTEPQHKPVWGKAECAQSPICVARLPCGVTVTGFGGRVPSKQLPVAPGQLIRLNPNYENNDSPPAHCSGSSATAGGFPAAHAPVSGPCACQRDKRCPGCSAKHLVILPGNTYASWPGHPDP